MKKKLVLLTLILLLIANCLYSQNTVFGNYEYGKMSDFLSFVSVGDIDKVKTSLKASPNIRETISCSKEGYGGLDIKMNALAIAAQTGNTTMAKCLIDNGFDVNEILFENRSGDTYEYLSRTAIAFAAEALNVNMVDFLLEHGAKPLGVYFAYEGFCDKNTFSEVKFNKEKILNKKRMYIIIEKLLIAGADPGEHNLLAYVSRSSDNTEIATLLIEKGANVNCTIYQNDTPLMFASERGNYDLVKLLLDHKADVNFTGDVNDFNAFTQALESRCHENLAKTLKLLLQRGSNIEGAHIDGLLYYIIISDDINALKLLNNPKTDIETADWLGHNALYWAAETGNLTMAKILISKGIKDNRKYNLNLAFLRAIINNDTQMAKLLLKSGSNVNYMEDYRLGDDFTLTCAVEKGSIEMVNLLLENGVNINGGSDTSNWRYRNIPLCKAVLNDDINIAKKLLEHGANACWQFNKNGLHLTYLDYARLNNDNDMFQLLKKHCIKYIKENFVETN